MSKSPDAFRTISEVADWLDTPAHVLRFWESKFSQVKPVKRAGGRRYYRPNDMVLLGGIKQLLHQDGLTIKEVQTLLREKGVKHVASLSPFELGDKENALTLNSVAPDAIDESPSDTPMFTSVTSHRAPTDTPQPELLQTDPSEDDSQLLFPGFEFATDRPKTFAKHETPAKTTPEPIDISGIPDLTINNISDFPKGPLARLAALSPGALANRSKNLTIVMQQLGEIAEKRANRSNS